MKTSLAVAFLTAFALTCRADIQDPPANDHGPTRKLGRGISNVAFGWSELPTTVAKVNDTEGNAAAASYGLVRGIGRTFARFGTGMFDIVTFPFPAHKGGYGPVLPDRTHWIHAGYSEFPPEPGFESKYPYVRKY